MPNESLDVEPLVDDSVLDSVSDESLDRLVQLDSDSDEIISDELMESLVSEIQIKSEAFDEFRPKSLMRLNKLSNWSKCSVPRNRLS